ncbi:hypothetical protein KAR02_14070, partial [Candidatus Bipolaricaulota bacterium]|nr:hypothetical protein [Candidatus Bipolaricaulota bacterium]
MITARVRALIAELGAKTAESKIAWKETSESGVYQVSFPSSSVQVLRTGSDIIFRLYNESGDLVEEVDDNGIDG